MFFPVLSYKGFARVWTNGGQSIKSMEAEDAIMETAWKQLKKEFCTIEEAQFIKSIICVVKPSQSLLPSDSYF